jgi:hypothetical protein
MKTTSRESFESIKPELTVMQQQIIIAMQGMKVIKWVNMSPDIARLSRYCGNYYQIAREVQRMGGKWSAETIRKRLPEMVKAEIIDEVGTNMGDAGRRCTVYQLKSEWLLP